MVEVPSAWVADRILFYPAAQEAASLWQIPISRKSWRITGAPERLTFTTGLDTSPDAAGADLHPSISSNGRRMVLRSNRSGNWDVWTKDLETGQESTLITRAATGDFTSISSDGSKVAYQENMRTGNKNHYLVEVGPRGRAGPPQKVCEGCGTLSDLSGDGQLLLYYTFPPAPHDLCAVTGL